jgi:galactokinase
MKDSFDYHSFCPFRVCPLGAHIDHQAGPVTGFALDSGITFDYSATDDGSIDVISRNYSGSATGNICDSYERKYTWADFLFGAVKTLQLQYTVTHGITGVVSGSLTGGGLSSSAAVILTYLIALSRANSITLTSPELIKLAVYEERNYIGVNVGTLDQSCEVYCRKNSLLYLDTLDGSAKLLPVPEGMKQFEIAIIFSGAERSLAGSAYNTRVDECKAASYALKDLAGLEYGRYADTRLRDVPFGVYLENRDRLPPHWKKRADHFYGESERVRKGIEAWQAGNLEAFGRLVFESGASSINCYETGSEELKALQTIMEETPGIYGGRFSGAGFNGCAMALVDPDRKDDITASVTERYKKAFPAHAENFFITYCRTADGIECI